jgi:UTP--glucose-1-phosphate uridylyltransferase
MSTVRRALVPAAGRGTRMRPFSLAVPKELAPLGSRPAIHFVLDEALAADIEDVVIVVSPGKELLRRYVELAAADGAWRDLRVTYVVQDEPTGLADAIALCEPVLGSEPFAVLLPDNLPLAADYRLARLIDVYERHRKHVVGVLELDSRWSGLYGNSGLVEHREVAPGVLAIDRLHDKIPGRLEIPPGTRVLRACGRYVFRPEVFASVAASLGNAADADRSEVPAVQLLARAGALCGAIVPGPLFDVGYPAGLLAACAFLARQSGSVAGAPP